MEGNIKNRKDEKEATAVMFALLCVRIFRTFIVGNAKLQNKN